jgi:hypothetical protein
MSVRLVDYAKTSKVALLVLDERQSEREAFVTCLCAAAASQLNVGACYLLNCTKLVLMKAGECC